MTVIKENNANSIVTRDHLYAIREPFDCDGVFLVVTKKAEDAKHTVEDISLGGIYLGPEQLEIIANDLLETAKRKRNE